MESFFLEPCDSKNFNIALLKERSLNLTRKLIERDDILCKVVVMPYDDHGLVFIPLVHDVNWK